MLSETAKPAALVALALALVLGGTFTVLETVVPNSVFGARSSAQTENDHVGAIQIENDVNPSVDFRLHEKALTNGGSSSEIERDITVDVNPNGFNMHKNTPTTRKDVYTDADAGTTSKAPNVLEAATKAGALLSLSMNGLNLSDVFARADHNHLEWKRSRQIRNGPRTTCADRPPKVDQDERCVARGSGGFRKADDCEADDCCYKVKKRWAKNQCLIKKRYMFDAEIRYEFAKAVSEFIFTALEFGTKSGYLGAMNMFEDMQKTLDNYHDVMHDIDHEPSKPDNKTAARALVQSYLHDSFAVFFVKLKAELVGEAKVKFLHEMKKWQEKYRKDKKIPQELKWVVSGGDDKEEWQHHTTLEFASLLMDEGVRKSTLLTKVFTDNGVQFSKLLVALPQITKALAHIKDPKERQEEERKLLAAALFPGPEGPAIVAAAQQQNAGKDCAKECEGKDEGENMNCMLECQGLTADGKPKPDSSFLEFAMAHGWSPQHHGIHNATVSDEENLKRQVDLDFEAHASALMHIDEMHEKLRREGDEVSFQRFQRDADAALNQGKWKCHVVTVIFYLVVGAITATICMAAAGLTCMPFFIIVTTVASCIFIICEILEKYGTLKGNIDAANRWKLQGGGGR
eukprot:gnl/MRDRNA2_/MRDRNA2_103856_c0_seq1.p1 gnl/MRDRNA2_/MRDRNA2_103856_c0~~gnl/MRDRNA2_/MRDRNA2_103856_c0_seq1.p1  ORF type:complete len:629 (-),score=121.66 gnl/MRDRNA2_/MRDRNA2_103856_c0_seq1:257-2143(-)